MGNSEVILHNRTKRKEKSEQIKIFNCMDYKLERKEELKQLL